MKIDSKKLIGLAIVMFLIFSTLLSGMNMVSAQGDGFSDAEEIDVPGEWAGELNATNEQDYYKFELEASQIIEIEFISQAGNDVGLTLYDQDREERFSVMSSEGSIGSDDLSLANETPTDFWFIEIEGITAGGWEGNYTFTVSIDTQNDATSGVDVSASLDEAYEISEGEHNGQIRDLDEKDMYKIELESSQIIDIEFVSQAGNDVRLRLYDPDHNEMLSVRSSEGMPDSDDLSLANETPTDFWFIEIEGITAGGWDGDYTFTISISRQDDAGIGGDAAGASPDISLPENPTSIGTGSFSGYMNENGDIRDIYGMDLVSGSTITVTVNPSSSMAINLLLADEGGQHLDEDTGNSLGEGSEVSFTPTSDEFVYIWLKCQGGDGTYDMDITVTGVDEPDKVTVESPTDVTSSSVDLSWSQSQIDDFDSYEIYVSTSSGSLGDLKETISQKTTTSTTIDGLSSDTTYYFTVRVVNTAGEGEDSDQVSATTSEGTVDQDGEDGNTTIDGDYPDIINDYIKKGMWCLALLIIIPILIIVVIVVVLVKLLKSGDSGGQQPPQQPQQRPPGQQPPGQQSQQQQTPPPTGEDSGEVPPPPPED